MNSNLLFYLSIIGIILTSSSFAYAYYMDEQNKPLTLVTEKCYIANVYMTLNGKNLGKLDEADFYQDTDNPLSTYIYLRGKILFPEEEARAHIVGIGNNTFYVDYSYLTLNLTFDSNQVAESDCSV